MQAQILSVTSCLLFLIIHNVNSETDVRKQEICDKLGRAFEVNGKELYHTHMATLKKMFKILLKEGKPIAEQAERLQKDIEDLEKLSKNITQMTPPELIESLKKFIQDKYYYYLRITKVTNGNFMADEKFVEETILGGIHKCDDASKKFAMSIYYAWNELYGTLSQDDLAKYSEYENINDLLEAVKESEGTSNSFIHAIKAIIRFFEYKDWQFFLEFDH